MAGRWVDRGSWSINSGRRNVVDGNQVQLRAGRVASEGRNVVEGNQVPLQTVEQQCR